MAFTSLIPFVTLLDQYYPELITQPNAPIDSADCAACRLQTYDFIIVGAGSAGSVLANRLSEIANWTVLLIEAGGDENYVTNTPGLHNMAANTRLDWNYTTVRQRYACGYTKGICGYPRGHVLGGTSSINGMVASRGAALDYEQWDMMGSEYWAEEYILPYFLRLENMTEPSLAADKQYHSMGGPLTVGYGPFRPDIINDILEAGADYGLNVGDYNRGERNFGIGLAQKTIQGAIRASSSKAYLEPIRLRKNLVIFKNTRVTRVSFNDETPRRAVGVSCVTNGEQYNLYTNKEVILSAGAVNSPQLLMLSGVGPRDHLQEHGIPVVADSPKVGSLLQDHPNIPVLFEINEAGRNCCYLYTHEAMLTFARDRSGQLSSPGLDVYAMLNRYNSTILAPEIAISAGVYTAGFESAPHLMFSLSIVDIKSMGSIRLKDNDYRTPPLIDPNYFSDRRDLDLALWGLREIFKIAGQASLARYSPRWNYTVVEECERFAYQSDQHLLCFILNAALPNYVPAGTARLGMLEFGKDYVVDQFLRVYKVRGLRIVDASVMSRLTRGPTNVPTMMVAEVASDLIKEEYSVLLIKKFQPSL